MTFPHPLLALCMLAAATPARAGLEPSPPARSVPSERSLPDDDLADDDDGVDPELDGELFLEEAPGEDGVIAPDGEPDPAPESAPGEGDSEGAAPPTDAATRTTHERAPPKEALGVFEVTIVGLDPELQQTAIDALATTIGELELYKVISRRDLLAMISAEMMKQSMGCDDPACAAELGMAAGVERLVTGSISKVQRALEINLQLVNTRYGTVENRVALTWKGPIDELSEVLAAAAELLVMPAKSRKPGNVQISGVPIDAEVALDGQRRGSGPVIISELPVGVHDLQVQAEGYLLHQAPVVVRSDRTTLVPVRLELAPESPFYATWWFWTIVGGVAAGAAGVTTAVVLGTSSPPPPQGTLVIGAPIPGRSTP